MRADGSEFPVELSITRADLPGPPLFCGYLRDVTEAAARERDLRRLVDEQAALRRVATAVAASTDPRRVFSVVTEEVARLLGAQSSNMVRFNADGTATVVGGWSEPRVAQHPGRRHGARWTATPSSARVYPHRRAGAGRQLRGPRRRARRAAARARLPSRPSPRRSSSTGGCGAR